MPAFKIIPLYFHLTDVEKGRFRLVLRSTAISEWNVPLHLKWEDFLNFSYSGFVVCTGSMGIMCLVIRYDSHRVALSGPPNPRKKKMIG